MTFKKTAVGLLAAVVAASAAAATAYADYQTDNNTQDNTYETSVTTSAPPANYDPQVSAGNEVTSWNIATTTTWTTTTVATDKPTSKPATVGLEVGEVKNGEFKVKLKIDSESLVSNASLSISYDNTIFEYVSSEQNEDAGGMAVENCFDGKYVYNYVNKDGTEFDGTFATLKFKVIDETMVSSVLYLSVTSLDDDKLVPISYSAENGIVKNPDAAVESEAENVEPTAIEIPLKNEPVQLSEYGIKDVKECTVEDSEVMLYENGAVLTLKTGTTGMDVTYNDDTKESFTVTVTEVEESSSSESAAAASTKEVSTPKKNNNSLRNLLIIGAVTIAVILVIVEYFVIMKPFGKKPKKASDDDVSSEDDAEDNDEMLAELEKAIAAKNEKAAKQRAEKDISDTQKLNQELIAQGFILADDADDDE